MPFRVALSALNLISFTCLLSGALTGCSSGEKLDSNTAEGSFKIAEGYVKDERYEEAIAQFNTVKNKFPYSVLATEAKLRIADVQFKREDYVEAQTAYQTFKEMHPSHAKIDYATYQLGLSLYHQLPPTIDRDLSIADKALLYLDEVVTSYPNSPFVKPAQEHKNKILRMLAEKELYIADFYFIRDKFDSALVRYAGLLNSYPNSEFAPKALRGAAISAHRLKDTAKAQAFLNELASRFANSKELRDAKKEIGHAN
jgi:outer membrane protein assembly factor BamD